MTDQEKSVLFARLKACSTLSADESCAPAMRDYVCDTFLPD